MPNIPPPHEYVPPGTVEEAPWLGYEPPKVRLDALKAVLDGVSLGDYDKRILLWLVECDDPTCRTIASIMWRCRQAAPPHHDRARRPDHA